ncbi:MAG: glycosyltransferase family 2 protein [Caldimonas sp.]
MPSESRGLHDRKPTSPTRHDMRPNVTLAVVIVAKNEAARIGDCIASAAFADEVLVLDSGSTDRTAQIAEAAGARVVVTDWPGYGPQVARGFALATGDWVFSLDADERISPALQAEVRRAIASDAFDGYRVPRWSEFCGRVMHHGGWRPDHTLRLGRRAVAGFTNDFLHAHMTVAGTVGTLDASLAHHSYPDVHDVLEKLDRYSSGSARDMQARGRRASLPKAIAHGLFAFVRTYLLKLGFLDGRHGLMLAIYNGEYAYYKYVKLMFMQSPPQQPEFPA